MVSQDHQNHKNEVPRGTQSHQNNGNSEKVKSNENINIYYTFEGLRHQNSPEFPFKNQQNTWLQSKWDFGLFKSEKIWKSDPEGSPMGDPKSIKNHWKSILAPSGCTLAPNDHQHTEKVVSQDPECLKNGTPRPQKINKSVKQNKWNLLGKIYAIANFPMISILPIFQIHLVYKSPINWLLEGPAAGAKP